MSTACHDSHPLCANCGEQYHKHGKGNLACPGPEMGNVYRAQVPLASNLVAWVLEIPGTSRPLYFGPNRCGGYLTDVTYDHMRAVRFQRQEDAITTADWLRLENCTREADPVRNFVPVEHAWMQPDETVAEPEHIELLTIALAEWPDPDFEPNEDREIKMRRIRDRMYAYLEKHSAQKASVRSTEGQCTCPPHLDPLGCMAETCPRAIEARRAVKTPVAQEDPCSKT